jgi:hypothetical protein
MILNGVPNGRYIEHIRAGRFPQLTINILYVDLLPLAAISKKGLALPWGRTDMALLPS